MARAGDAAPKIEPPTDHGAFLVVCDTGEGDASQYASVPAIEHQRDTDFMVICGDVIYPAGDVNEYVEKFYFPYRNYPGPIYGVPGNHDWYDSLNGFMQHFCGKEPLRREPQGLLTRLLDLLWRRASVTDPATAGAGRALRPQQDKHDKQPGPYWSMDLGPFVLVAVDPGISNRLDRQQGEWLLRVSQSGKPKVLLTGKPLMVDAKLDPACLAAPLEMADGARACTVDDIVANPDHQYVAAIGGDIHNYQHYVARPHNRVLHYLVSGGGGAFMHATHKIPQLDPDELHGATHGELVLYPTRGDSLAFFSHIISRRLGLGRRLEVFRGDGSALTAEWLSEEPTTPEGKAAKERGVGPRARRNARFIRHFGGKPVQRFLAEVFDWNEPPLFKSFLRLDWDEAHIEVRCIAATGCGEDEVKPPVVDHFKIPLARTAPTRAAGVAL